MSAAYVFELYERKFYITELKNDIIEPIETMIKKIIPDNDSEKIKTLLTQNLATTLSSIKWIEYFPIKSIFEIKHNYNLETVFIKYVKEFGIDNVRCDLYKNMDLTDNEIKYIQDNLNKSKEPIENQLKNIDQEIDNLKKILDILNKNNTVINQYLKYNSGALQSAIYQEIQIQNQNHILRTINGNQIKVTSLQKYHQKLNGFYINLLNNNFIDIFIAENLKNEDHIIIDIIKPVLENFFSNHTILEGIANALYLQKSNEKLISIYGKLDNISKTLTTLMYKKIELLHQLELDDIIL
jgi:5-bromo-4-chloroindolyl phosphate hydrolysis protein